MADARILIADSAVFVRRALKDLCEREAGLCVVGLAQNGKEVVEKLSLKPDLVILDIDIADVDGLTALREIRRRQRSLPVIIYSTANTRVAGSVDVARSLGGVDYVQKTAVDGRSSSDAERELLSKVRLICARARHGSLPPKRATDGLAKANVRPNLVVIGSSTGGPPALTEALSQLPRALSAPVVVVQHMPTALFTESLVKSLSRVCKLPVIHARDGDVLSAGSIWVAPGGKHLTLVAESSGTTVRLTDDPLVNGVRPAVDLLFTSAAHLLDRTVLGVVLTGMGRDGLKGAEAIVKAGGTVIAQDEETSVVWGMPGAVAEAGLTSNVVPIGRIGGDIRARVGISAAARTAPTVDK
jgi:two-component system, chemotaxis family, protein-glutamate methylesterase/glutaminase